MAQCAESGLALLRAAQNPDGGWGYFPGNASWLEPTAYALLALSEEAEARRGIDRGMRLLDRWVLSAGGWQASEAVKGAHWASSLVVTLHTALGRHDESTARAVDWLLETSGAETRTVSRIAHWLSPRTVEFDASLSGWPWQPGTSAWIEPTAHVLMALRHLARGGHPGARERVAAGQAMLLERRCRDGGWNYGNRRVLGVDLPSHPETTALALMALDGHPEIRWGEMLDRVERLYRETRSPWARAWLGACLLQYRGVRPESRPAGNDLLVTAVEAIRWDRIMGAA
ncbi:MAG TPA: prenyltransferase/squalene oxidase repeat-containing protein [Bryobacteraceae bacterium]|nr:prenyltransferase/squalene oxidase repeat-containing protein [Bryobacteraceae bacterium]